VIAKNARMCLHFLIKNYNWEDRVHIPPRYFNVITKLALIKLLRLNIHSSELSESWVQGYWVLPLP
jgi:hypothetical protein